MTQLIIPLSIMLVAATAPLRTASAAERDGTARIVTSSDHSSDRIEGLEWDSHTLDVTRRGEEDVALLEGVFERENWNLTFHEKRIVLGKDGSFTLPVPLAGRVTRVEINAIGPKGGREKQVLDVVKDADGAAAGAFNVRYLNFAASGNYLFNSSDAYSIGGGVAYTPRFDGLLPWNWVDAALDLGVQFAKESESSIFPVIEMRALFPIAVAGRFSVAPGGGYGLAIQNAGTEGFVLASADVAYGLEESGILSVVDRVYVRYSYFFSDNTTHEIQLGAGFDFQ